MRHGYSRTRTGVTTGVSLRHRIALRIKGLLADRREQDRMRMRSEDRLQAARNFYTLYEDLVDVLLSAANYGPNAGLQERYESLRSMVAESYPQIKPYLLAYLRMSIEDAEFGLKHFSNSADAFEILYRFATLDEFVRLDDGEMIGRITRTREALTLYTEHLRYLVQSEG